MVATCIQHDVFEHHCTLLPVVSMTVIVDVFWKVAKLTLDVLQYLCNEDHFYAQVLLEQVRFKVYAPALLRKRKAPQ